MRYGLARGMYANEAGYGTAAVAYGTAQSRHPVQQGLNAMMEVFIVSFVTCTISAMTILLSGAWQSGQTSTAAVALAFDAALPGIGAYVVAFCVFLFGYTTLIGWAFYGEQFLEYIFGPRIVVPYRWIYCLLIPLGAISKVELVWAWGDLMNALQIFPNVIGVLGSERAGGEARAGWLPCSRRTSSSLTAARSGFTREQPFEAGSFAPSPSAQRVAGNSHLRWHPLRGEWIAYASHRQHRTFLPPPEWNPLAVTVDPAAPTEVPPGPWEVAVFENMFPTLSASPGDPPAHHRRDTPWRRQLRGRRFHAGSGMRRSGVSISIASSLIVDVWADRYTAARRARRRGVRVSVREPRRRGRGDAAPSARADLRLSVRAASGRARAVAAASRILDAARPRPDRGPAARASSKTTRDAWCIGAST